MGEVKRSDIKEYPENYDDMIASYLKSQERAEEKVKESKGEDALTTAAARSRIKASQSHGVETEPVDKDLVLREPSDPAVIAERDKTRDYVRQKLSVPQRTDKPGSLGGRVRGG